VSCVVWFTNK